MGQLIPTLQCLLVNSRRILSGGKDVFTMCFWKINLVMTSTLNSQSAEGMFGLGLTVILNFMPALRNCLYIYIYIYIFINSSILIFFFKIKLTCRNQPTNVNRSDYSFALEKLHPGTAGNDEALFRL